MCDTLGQGNSIVKISLDIYVCMYVMCVDLQNIISGIFTSHFSSGLTECGINF